MCVNDERYTKFSLLLENRRSFSMRCTYWPWYTENGTTAKCRSRQHVHAVVVSLWITLFIHFNAQNALIFELFEWWYFHTTRRLNKKTYIHWLQRVFMQLLSLLLLILLLLLLLSSLLSSLSLLLPLYHCYYYYHYCYYYSQVRTRMLRIYRVFPWVFPFIVFYFNEIKAYKMSCPANLILKFMWISSVRPTAALILF